MKYNFLVICSLVLMLFITFSIHLNRPKKKIKRKKTLPTVETFPRPLGKGFMEYIPPGKHCSSDKGCHAGSYVRYHNKS